MSEKVYELNENSKIIKDGNNNLNLKEKQKLNGNLNEVLIQNNNPGLINDQSQNQAIINYKEISEKFEKKEKEYKERIDNLNRILELERSNSTNIQRELNEKIQELKDKEKIISTISVTNNKLMVSLESLKKEVDDKLDKVSFKQVSDKMKGPKENPIDVVLRVKEKELKNTMNLLEILKKDNENLKKSMNEQINISSYIDLQNKIKYKDSQIIELQGEIKLLSRSSDEHNKCIENKKEFENEKKYLKEEIKKHKESIRDLQIKLKEEETKHSKTKDNFINLKRQIEASNRSLLVTKINHPYSMTNIQVNENINNKEINSQNAEEVEKINSAKIKNLNHDENIIEAISADNKANNNNLQINIKARDYTSIDRKNLNSDPKILSMKKRTLEMGRSRESSNNVKNLKKNKLAEDSLGKDRLFTSDDRIKLEKIMTIEDIEKYEKKYEFIDHARVALENKLKVENKLTQRKLQEKEDQIEYLNLQYKEAEQKNKIYSFQINEYKNEQKVFHRKINDMQKNLKSLYKIISELEEEKKLLTSQLTNLRKLVKHNAVPPMDSEIVKHLEKIKNSNNNENEDESSNVNLKDAEKISNFDANSIKAKRNSVQLDEANLLNDNSIKDLEHSNINHNEDNYRNMNHTSQSQENENKNLSSIDKNVPNPSEEHVSYPMIDPQAEEEI